MKHLRLTSVILIMASIILVSCDKTPKQAGYAGEDLSGNFSITRDNITREATLHVKDIRGAWKVYAGPQVDSIDFSMPIVEGRGADPDGYSLGVPTDRRSYFQIEAGKNRMILAESRLPMEGGYNFRDLGGFRTKDDKHVKWGKLFRTDDMNALTREDLQYLASIPINTVIDFRAEEEAKEAPDALPSKSLLKLHFPITPGNISVMTELENIPEAELVEKMKGLYVDLLTDSLAQIQYRRFFKFLQTDQTAPVIYHCSAGKDRTGIATALVLYAMGVDDQTIMEDYMASNEYLAGKYDFILGRYPNLKPLMEVRPEYLQAAVDYMVDNYGSVENYLSDGLIVATARLRELYLD